jgi:hypothetical protein
VIAIIKGNLLAVSKKLEELFKLKVEEIKEKKANNNKRSGAVGTCLKITRRNETTGCELPSLRSPERTRKASSTRI